MAIEIVDEFPLKMVDLSIAMGQFTRLGTPTRVSPTR